MNTNQVLDRGLTISNIGYWVENEAGQKQTIIKEFSLNINPGEFITFYGKSGCGKTTLLNMISGLLPPKQGNIFLNGQKVIKPSKDIAFVFQESVLYPYLTIRKNIEFGMKMKGIPEKIRQKKTDELLEKVGLSKHGNKYPLRDKLSGGMKQRAEIASVLADESKVIIMDEPFGALDDETRDAMQTLILDVWKDFGRTILFVTHNKSEALIVSDKVILMPENKETPFEQVNVDLARPRNDNEPQFLEYRKILGNHLIKTYA